MISCKWFHLITTRATCMHAWSYPSPETRVLGGRFHSPSKVRCQRAESCQQRAHTAPIHCWDTCVFAFVPPRKGWWPSRAAVGRIAKLSCSVSSVGPKTALNGAIRAVANARKGVWGPKVLFHPWRKPLITFGSQQCCPISSFHLLGTCSVARPKPEQPGEKEIQWSQFVRRTHQFF